MVFYQGKWMGCRRSAIRQPCAPKVDPSLWTLQTTKTLLRFSVLKRPRRPRPLSAMLCWSSPLSTVACADWTPLRFFKVATGSESSGDELESRRTTDASTQESSNIATSCTNWCLDAVNPPPPRPQISYTILTQVDWCAVRAAARCELGLLPVLHTAETGVRVFW